MKKPLNKTSRIANYRKNLDQKKYFDSISTHYSDDNQISIEYLDRLRKVSSSYIKGKVLDIGNGGIVCFDYKKASSITLADIAFELLKYPKVLEGKRLKALKKNSKTKFVKASVLDLPFPDDSFDVVILFNVAHHLSVPSLKESIKNIDTAFKEIKRVLKKEGFFLLSDNCPASIIKFFFDPFFEFAYWFLLKFKIPLPYFLSLSQIEFLLKKNGLVLIKKRKIKLSQKTYQPLLPWFSPPGWLWDKVLGNMFFVIRK